MSTLCVPSVWLSIHSVSPQLCSAPAAVTSTPDAPAAAKERLKAKGALSKGEMATLASLGVAVTMWVFGEQLKVSLSC